MIGNEGSKQVFCPPTAYTGRVTFYF